MTVEEFLVEFKRVATNYKWVVRDGCIRGYKVIGRREYWCCPLVAHYETCRNVSICDVTSVVSSAADNKLNHDSSIRSRILEICGLKE